MLCVYNVYRHLGNRIPPPLIYEPSYNFFKCIYLSFRYTELKIEYVHFVYL